MRPSSSPSDTEPGAEARSPSGLFGAVLTRGPVHDETADRAWLQAMLDAEAALAGALCDVGLAPTAHADVIAAQCVAERFDVEEIGRGATSGGNPVIPLVRALRAMVGADAANTVHRGATSQDVLDTAAMLVARRSLDPILADLEAAAVGLAERARIHRDTPMAGRTLLQHAVPTTFGLVAANWLLGIDAAARRLRAVRDERLAAQLGGAAGTLDGFDGRGREVVARFAARLELAAPVAPWHTERSRIAELAGALGGAATAIGKVATDLVLLAQTEIAEVHEGGDGGRGGSSAMPHKRNPVGAISARASVLPVPGLVASLLGAAYHEHQRAAGAWHAEWLPLTALLRAVGSGAAWLRETLAVLEVDPDRMLSNLERTGGLVHAERIANALAPALGREQAHELVGAACAVAARARRPLGHVLADDPRVADVLTTAGLDELLDPTAAVAAAAALVDQILAAHERGGDG